MSESQDRIRKFLSETQISTEDQDARFGDLAVERGYVTRSQLDQCLGEQATLKESGESPRVGQLLLKKGYITTQKFLELLALQNKRLRVCVGCGRVHDISGHSSGVTLRCLKCGEELQAQQDEPDVPKREDPKDTRPCIGKYRLAREIGRGGMAVVYEAEDPELQRPVALKVLRDINADPHVIRRLHREAAIVGQLRHPNIVGIHEVGMVRDTAGQPTHFIAMDYVAGRTMSEVLAGKSTPQTDLIRMLEEIARAVAYGHSKGVIHRDLKPENVLVDESGRVVLTDFGLAHGENFKTKLTRTNAVMGTPHYMAPEQVEGDTQKIGERTDIYALGVMLYEILTGRPPFTAESPAELYKKIVDEEPRRPMLVRSVDRDLEIICLKAIEKDPERRYLTALDFAEDLSRFAKNEAIQARPPSLFYLLRKGIIRRKALLVGAAAVLLVGISVFYVSRWLQFRDARAAAIEAFKGEDWSRAVAECTRALELFSDGSLDSLLVEARDKLDRKKTDEDSRMARAESYRELQERMEPIESLIRETRPFFYIRSVDIRAKLIKVEKALAQLLELADDPEFEEFPEPWALLGIGWSLAGNNALAEKYLLKAERLKSRDPWVFYHLGRVYLTESMASQLQGTDETGPADRKTAQILAAKAEKYLSRMTRDAPGAEEMDLEVVRGYTELAKGNFKEASLIAEAALQKWKGEPGTEEFWNIEGWCWGGTSRKRQLAVYVEAVRRKPHYAWGHFMMGNAYSQLGRHDESISAFDKALHINPRFLTAYMNRGVMKINSGDPEGALQDYNKAVELNPGIPQTYGNRARARWQTGDREGAMADVTLALELDDRQPLVYLNRGVFYLQMNEISKAFDDFDKVIEIAPKIPEGYVNKGSVLLDMKRYKEALALFDKALEVARPGWPKLDHVRRLKGEAELGLNKNDE